MAAQMMVYVAVEEFVLSMEDGKSVFNVKKGNEILFDGWSVEYNGNKGSSKSLAKVIGTWIQPKDKAVVRRVVNRGAGPSRNRTAGRILEQSSVDVDPDTKQMQQDRKLDEYRELQTLVDKHETQSGKTIMADDMEDIKREVKVVNEDASIVRETTKTATTGVKNSSGVEIETNEPKPRQVISAEERVVKQTNYEKRPEAEAPRKRLVVDREAAGVEVRKTGTPGAQKVASEKAPGRATVSKEEDTVMETSYENNQHTDIGSSTQKQVATTRTTKKVIVGKTHESEVSEERKGPKVVRPAADMQAADARVVGKVSKIRPEAPGAILADDGSARTSDGITATLKVGGSSDMDVGEAQFSSSGDMDVGDVEISSGGDGVVDLGGGGLDTSEGDVNVDDILKQL